MIAAFSTSSAVASVALLERDGRLIAAAAEDAPMRASGACLKMLRQLLKDSGIGVGDLEGFAADLGPGSFTGVKVAVTLAKTFAFAHHKPTFGATSFDLIAPDRVVVFPSKRGEWFVRRLDGSVETSTELPDEVFIGFGPGVEPAVFPLAERFSALMEALDPVEPLHLVPAYFLAPSISTPKKPYGEVRG